MRKALLFLVIAAICFAVAFRYFGPDFSWITDASDEPNGPIADLDRPLPHAVLPSLSGDWVDLSVYKGQVVFIVFWAAWCPGCVDEVPNLIHLQQEFADKGFTIVALAIDDEGEESVGNFVGKRRFAVNGDSKTINYPVLLGSTETAVKLGFEGGLPAGILVNRDGREVKIVRGTVSEAALSKAIQKFVKR
jgi:thiol-disulfide isomerase/thioredoxin